MAKLILYAPNVHTGGGKSLLLPLLKVLKSYDCKLILDTRLENIADQSNTILKVKPTFMSRYKAEVVLKKSCKKGDIVLCFHSLPPIFKNDAKVLVYFHNKHLIGSRRLILNETPRVIFRLTLERILAWLFYKNVDEYFVQTSTMMKNFEFYYSKKMSKVSIFSYTDSNSYLNTKRNIDKDLDFIYVSEGPMHKNHLMLIKAWVLLAKEGLFPKLTLTLSSDNHLIINDINKNIKMHKIKIENLGYIDANKVLKLYSNAKALIFPSLMESFGLPLIEAKFIGLPILASELDYVRDVCSPVETFDPKSEISIARAVKRFLKISQNDKQSHSAEDFATHILKNF